MYRIIPYETKTDKNQGTDMNPADDPDLQPLQPPQNPLPAPTPQLPTDGVAPPDPVFAQAVVSAQSLTQQPAPPTAPGVEQPAVQPFTAPEPVNPTDQVTDQFSSQPVVSPDLDTFAVPDTKPARRKLPLIIAGSAMAVLMVVGAGWFFVGQDMLDSNGARQVSDEGAAGMEGEDSLISAAQSDSAAAEAAADAKKAEAAAEAAANGGASGSAAKKGTTKTATASTYNLTCTVTKTQQTEINPAVKKQVERAIRVSYNGDLVEHVSWVPPSVVKKIRNGNNQPKDVQKVFRSIKPKSCEIIGSLKPDKKGEIVGVMVKYASSTSKTQYSNTIMVVNTEGFAATLDVSKPSKI